MLPLRLLPSRLAPFMARPEQQHRLFAATSAEDPLGNEGEKRLAGLLRLRFPKAAKVVAHDQSNGCGSMYQVIVESIEFAGMSKVQQHKAITATLQEEIKSMHGLVIQTKALKDQ